METRMSFPTFYFKKKYEVKIVAFISLILPIISFCDGSIIHQTSRKDGEMKQSSILIGNEVQEEFFKLVKDIQSCRVSTDQDIRLLKKENENQRGEILQIKFLLHNFLLQESNKTAISNKTVNDEFGEISIKRASRSVKATSSARKIPSNRKPTIKPQVKSSYENPSSDSWAKLEISDLVIGPMDYDTYSVKIYNHASNKDVNVKNEEKKYYFEPIGQLEHLSAKSSLNNVSTTKPAEMIFKVNMWTDKVRAAVHKFISDDLKLGPVNINLVRVLPLDEVMMFSGSRPSPHFEMDHNWINYKSDQFLKFKFICDKIEHCDHLAVQMKTNPEQFNLKMRFSLSSQNSQTKQTKINIDTIMSGEMMNQMDQKFKEKEKVLLTAEGKNQLVKESSENIIVQTVDDFKIPTKDSRNEVYRRLENMLQFSRIIIQKGDEKAWQNVFWNQDNFRPDMSAKIINDMYNKLDGEDQKKFASSFTNTNKAGFEGSMSALGGIISGSVGANADFSREGMEKKGSLEKLLKESRENIEWNGIKFVPKQMELYSLNMARLKNKQTFKDMNVKISYTTSMLTIDVRHDSSFEPETSSELSKFKSQIAEMQLMLNSMSTQFGQLDKQGKETLNEFSKFKPWVEFRLDEQGEETSSKFSEFRSWSETQFLDLYELGAEISSGYSKLKDRVLGYLSTRTFIWHITNYRFKKAAIGATHISYGPFNTSNGYKLQDNLIVYEFNPLFLKIKRFLKSSCLEEIYVYLNGDDGNHLSIYLEIQPGEYDAILPWPFSPNLTITLIDQSTNTKEKNNVEMTFDDSDVITSPELFERPLNNKPNGRIGVSKFVAHDLLAEGGKYVKDDTLFLQMKIRN